MMRTEFLKIAGLHIAAHVGCLVDNRGLAEYLLEDYLHDF